jgi:hypothetical protein
VSETLTIQKAIDLLKKIVKYSNVPQQKHIDLGLVMADELDLYKKALVTVNVAVDNGDITREELNKQIGIP